MSTHVLQALGGLGLFILGMLIMTEGLRSVAGDRLNRWLYRFTRSPSSGAASGAAITALVQSSSATTVATVGFVSAGLMTFSQALGVLLGANMGTTVTGWMIVLLGFKLEIGRLMLPVLFAGVLVRLLGRGPVRSGGWAVAGFAVLFLGIDQLRGGLAHFEGVVTPADFPPDTWGGRLLLVMIGIAVTLVTQSSSAGVAAALGAIAAGAISFPQAAVMVIGMDVGTTSTAVLATIGGGVQTRRTGYAHTVFNLLAAIGALLILDPYMVLVNAWSSGGVAARPMLALVGFHTTFNTLGVLVVLPFADGFARLMLRLVPEREPVLAHCLERGLLEDTAAATLALVGAVRQLAVETFELLAARLPRPGEAGGEPLRARRRLAEIEQAVGEARRYSDLIHITPGEKESYDRLLASMHCLDHLDRLLDRCRQEERLATLAADARLLESSADLRRALERTTADLGEPGPAVAEAVDAARRRLGEAEPPYRATVLERVAADQLELDDAIHRLDASRWLHRTAYHAWRIVYHLQAVLGRGEAGGRREIPRRSELEPWPQLELRCERREPDGANVSLKK